MDAELNRTIFSNDQARACLEDFAKENSIEEIRIEAHVACETMKMFMAQGATRLSLFCCLAAAKLMEMLEQKQREAAP